MTVPGVTSACVSLDIYSLMGAAGDNDDDDDDDDYDEYEHDDDDDDDDKENLQRLGRVQHWEPLRGRGVPQSGGRI